MPYRRHAGRRPADRAARQGRPGRRSSRATAGSRSQGTDVSPAGRRRARRGDRAAAGGRLLGPERVPHLADVRRHQLAGPLHPAVRAVGRQPAALRPARRERPAHPQRRLQAGRLAHRRRRPVQHHGLARGRRRSTTTTALRRPQRRLPGPRFSYAADARPVHAVAPSSAASSRSPGTAGDGRDRPGVQPHPVGAAAADGRLGRRSATARSSTAMPAQAPVPAACGATPSRCGPPTGSRSSTRSTPHLVRADVPTTTNLVLVVLGDHQPRDHRLRPGREPRRADHGHRPRPGGAGPDLRLGLAGRPAASTTAPLADGRLPRPLPRGLRPATVRRLGLSR